MAEGRLQAYLRGRQEEHNGGDVAVCPHNLQWRASTLPEIDVSPIAVRHPRCTPRPTRCGLNAGTRERQAALAAEEQAVRELVTACEPMRDTPEGKPRPDPTWAPPLTGQPWTGMDMCQCVQPHSHRLYHPSIIAAG
jgi:hypothetical protein